MTARVTGSVTKMRIDCCADNLGDYPLGERRMVHPVQVRDCAAASFHQELAYYVGDWAKLTTEGEIDFKHQGSDNVVKGTVKHCERTIPSCVTLG